MLSKARLFAITQCLWLPAGPFYLTGSRSELGLLETYGQWKTAYFHVNACSASTLDPNSFSASIRQLSLSLKLFGHKHHKYCHIK